MQSNGQSILTNQQPDLGQETESRGQPTVQLQEQLQQTEQQPKLQQLPEKLSLTDQPPKLIEQPTEQPIEQQTEQSIEQQTEQPIKQQTEQSIEQQTEQPIEQQTEQSIEQQTEQPIEQQTEQSIEQQTKQLTVQLTEDTKLPLQATSQSLYQPTTSSSYKAPQLETEKKIIKHPIQESNVTLSQPIDETSTSTTITTTGENVDLLTKKVTIFHFNCLNLL